MTARELFILLSLSACSASVTYQSEAPEEPSSRFRRFLDEVQLARLDRDPGARSRAGLGPQGAWPDTTGRTEAVDAALTEAERARLAEFSPVALDPQLRRSHLLLAYETERRLERLRWSEHEYLAVADTGPLGLLHARLLQGPAWTTPADAEAWIRSVSDAAPWLDEVTELLQARAGRGLLAPKLALEQLLREAGELAAGRPLQPEASQDGPLLHALQEQVAGLPEASPETRESLLLRGRIALQEDLGPALERWLEGLEALATSSPGDSGAWSRPEGEAWYAWRLRDATTLPVTPEALHRLALDEVARLHLALEGVQEELGQEGDLGDLLDLLRREPSLTTPQPALVAEQVNRLRGALPEVASAAPSARVPTTADEVPRYALLAHLARYGVPGAALRESVVHSNGALPAFRRGLSIPAWSEGWDLYAAGLPLGLGLASDPIDVAGILAEELWAVSLLVVDTGVHHERWNLDQARDWLRANTPAGEEQLEAALLEILVRPGAAASAPVGCLRLRELRAAAERRLGMRFDPVAFHDRILALGPVTLAMLEGRLRAWEESR